jgi:ergothioneine biosynthesis protein EgtB
MVHGRAESLRAGAPRADAALLSRLSAAWRRSDALFAVLAPEALWARPIPLRHPFIFYLGHLPAFAWNQIARGVLARPSFRAAFDELFERGIDPGAASDVPQIGRWPPVEQVLAYRDRCRDEIRKTLPDVAGRAGSDVLAARGRIYSLVVEHELMHHETLLYMVQQLPHDQKVRPKWLGDSRPAAAAWPRRVPVPAGEATLGASFEDLAFGWDNEFPRHVVPVAAFEIDSLPVRNRDYREFVAAGGYQTRALWDDAGWQWKEAQGLHAPLFWKDGARFLQQGTFEDRPLEEVLDSPVSVSACEARAYARWTGGRLPTEAEFHRAAYGTPGGDERPFPWGDDPPAERHGRFGFTGGSPAPAGAFPAGASAWGVYELVGNGWEWTSSPFAPFPGFTPYARTYPGYSQDFFDGRHDVLKGASWATDVALVRRSFRNWFQPRYPYVFAKFRCVRPG